MRRGGPLHIFAAALERIAVALTDLLAVIVSVLLSALASVVLWQVISRYVVGEPSVATEDLVQILLPWFGLLGAAWTFRMKGQLAVEFLSTLLHGEMLLVVTVAVDILILFFALVVMAWGGSEYSFERLSRGQLTEILDFPVGYIYMAVPVGGLLIALFALSDIVAILRGAKPASGPDRGGAL